jgi:hypothetical protein
MCSFHNFCPTGVTGRYFARVIIELYRSYAASSRGVTCELFTMYSSRFSA